MSDESKQGPADVRRVEQEIAEFLARNRAALLEHARYLVHTRPGIDPDDLVQAASLAFYRYWRERGEAIVDRGLLALAKQCVATALNDVVKWHQAKKRPKADALPSSSLAPAARQTGPVTAANRNELAARVRAAMQLAFQELEPLDRSIIDLRMEDEDIHTFAAIGSMLGMTADAVRMRYQRAMKAIKPLLRDYLQVEGPDQS
ncbi:MAG TPA: sigma-70 family RNA polymerase sigma factor [Planctomycetota bacterium]|nr:sigma-70 family RNA polymerase sigma factor [Planctomycetota bacterium]